MYINTLIQVEFQRLKLLRISAKIIAPSLCSIFNDSIISQFLQDKKSLPFPWVGLDAILPYWSPKQCSSCFLLWLELPDGEPFLLPLRSRL